MTQAVIDLNENDDRVVNIVKGKFGLKNKSEAMSVIINGYEQEILEPELRPEFIEEMRKIEKEKPIAFKNIKELRALIEK